MTHSRTFLEWQHTTTSEKGGKSSSDFGLNFSAAGAPYKDVRFATNLKSGWGFELFARSSHIEHKHLYIYIYIYISMYDEDNSPKNHIPNNTFFNAPKDLRT